MENLYAHISFITFTYMHACIHVCMRACMHVYMYARVYVNVMKLKSKWFVEKVYAYHKINDTFT